MKSARLTSFASPLQLCELPIPQPSGSEVLLRVVSAGICHTDLHLADGGYDAGRGEKLHAADRGVKLPLTLGHEIVGRPIGSNQDYLVYPWIGCGTCRACGEGNENLCAQPPILGIYRDGGYAEYVLVPHQKYLLPLNGIDPLRSAPLRLRGADHVQCSEKGWRAYPRRADRAYWRGRSRPDGAPATESNGWQGSDCGRH